MPGTLVLTTGTKVRVTRQGGHYSIPPGLPKETARELSLAAQDHRWVARFEPDPTPSH